MDKIQLSKPSLGEDELSAVREVFSTGYLGMGEYVREFENKLGVMFNRQAVCVSSGTAALQLALEAIGINKGDEVLVQSMTYTATYQAIIAAGGIPISCDINELDLSLDLSDAKRKLTKKTKAILPVHYGGYAGRIKELYSFASDNKLRVIEDAAHAFGSSVDDNLVGSFGDICCFSFDPVKSITCGEGGAIITNDTSVIRHVQSARILGLNKDTGVKLEDNSFCYEFTAGQGWRYHMSNVSAAIGLVQLGKSNDLIRKRRLLAFRYAQNLSDEPKLSLLPYNYNDVAPYIFVVLILDGNRDKILENLKKFGIHAGFHYYPCHLHPYFSQFGKYYLPVTENIYSKLLTLPMHADLEIKHVDFVSTYLKRELNN